MIALSDEERVVATPGKLNNKQALAAVIFVSLAVLLATLVPIIESAWVSSLSILAIYLYALEAVSVEVAAISILVLLGLTTLFAPLMGLEQGLVDNRDLFDGFASNAVMPVIAVIITVAGLYKSGIITMLFLVGTILMMNLVF
jgi:hypothetical protein